MNIDKKNIEGIRKNETTLVKNFIVLPKKYDFNYISDLLEENHLPVGHKEIGPNINFLNICQLFNVHTFDTHFLILKDFLSKLFQYKEHPKDGADLFFSVTTSTGQPHIDKEDIFLIGLHGSTIYRVYGDRDYTIEPGDFLFIPRDLKHRAIGLTPRVILSIGFFGDRNMGPK